MTGSDIVSAIHHLKMADEHMQSFMRDRPVALLTKLFSVYSKKVNWVLTDIKTCPCLPDVVIEGIRSELNSDVFCVAAIHQKIALIPVNQREAVEAIIDEILKGQIINVVKDRN